jgi:hypothetical protein
MSVALPSQIHLSSAPAAPVVHARPARPAPYYTLRYVRADGSVDHGTRLYFVPTAGILRTSGIAAWLPLGEAEGVFRRAVHGLRPFPRPRVIVAEVDGRTVSDPASYLRLYMIEGKRAADPASAQPLESAGGFVEWSRYYERVRKHWLPVSLWTARRSPWGDGDNFLWVGRRLPLLKRDGDVIAMSESLAACIRRAVSLRGC